MDEKRGYASPENPKPEQDAQNDAGSKAGKEGEKSRRVAMDGTSKSARERGQDGSSVQHSAPVPHAPLES